VALLDEGWLKRRGSRRAKSGSHTSSLRTTPCSSLLPPPNSKLWSAATATTPRRFRPPRSTAGQNDVHKKLKKFNSFHFNQMTRLAAFRAGPVFWRFAILWR
jgi:hypothetical protein